MKVRQRATLLVLATALAGPATGQVVNGDFDSGVAHWGLILGTGGILDWDAASGAPAPGSASAGNVFPGAHVDGWAQCVPFSARDFALSAAVASALQAGNSCRVKVDFIANADCINDTPIVVETVLTNTRNDAAFETLAGGGPLPDGVLAAAVSLEHVRVKTAAAGDSFCHFDHVTLTPDTLFEAAFD